MTKALIITIALLVAMTAVVIWQYDHTKPAPDSESLKAQLTEMESRHAREAEDLKAMHKKELADYRAANAAEVSALKNQLEKLRASQLATRKRRVAEQARPENVRASVTAAVGAPIESIRLGEAGRIILEPAAISALLERVAQCDDDLAASDLECQAREKAAEVRGAVPMMERAHECADHALSITQALEEEQVRRSAAERRASAGEREKIWIGVGAGSGGLVLGAAATALTILFGMH